MDKQTLSNYGWLVIVTLILAVMLAFATPFGTYVGDGVVSIANGYVQSSNNATDKDNISKLEQQWTDKLGTPNNTGEGNGNNTVCCNAQNIQTYGDDTKCLNCGNVVYGSDTHGGLVPVDGAYYVFDGTCDLCYFSYGDTPYCYCGGYTYDSGVDVCPNCSFNFKTNEPSCYCGSYYIKDMQPIFYSAGEELPQNLEWGHKYVYKDYVYSLSQIYSGGDYVDTIHVGVLDKTKTQYVDMESVVFSMPVEDLSNTFGSCSNMVSAPVLSTNATTLYSTFSNCTSLANLDNFSFPSKVTSLNYTFSNCTSLIETPFIPNHISNIDGTFMNCTSLTTITNLPNSITNMGSAFYGCSSLVDIRNITFPNVKEMFCTFRECYSLKYVPQLPSTLEGINNTFNDCTSLIELPAIPQNVTNLNFAFSGCTSIKTYAGSTDADGDFSNYIIPNGVTIMYGTFKNTPIVYAPTIPSNVNNLRRTFNDCTKLKGDITINTNKITTVKDTTNNSGYECFSGTTNSIKIIGSASSTVKSLLASTATNGNVTY